jgi:hypothetical protein
MKRNPLSVALLLLCVLVLCRGRAANVMAATSTDKAIFQCQWPDLHPFSSNKGRSI